MSSTEPIIRTSDPHELQDMVLYLEGEVRKAQRAEKDAAAELRQLRVENLQLFAYNVHNVLTVPEWAERHGGLISNSAVLSLIQNGDIDSVKKGRNHFIVLTEKTLQYKRGTRGPKHESKRARAVRERQAP